jgi:hypothetical protein
MSFKQSGSPSTLTSIRTYFASLMNNSLSTVTLPISFICWLIPSNISLILSNNYQKYSITTFFMLSSLIFVFSHIVWRACFGTLNNHFHASIWNAFPYLLYPTIYICSVKFAIFCRSSVCSLKLSLV